MNEIAFHHLLFVWLTHFPEASSSVCLPGPQLRPGDGEVALCMPLWGRSFPKTQKVSKWAWGMEHLQSPCKAGAESLWIFSNDPQGDAQIFSHSVLGQSLKIVLKLAANFPDCSKQDRSSSEIGIELQSYIKSWKTSSFCKGGRVARFSREDTECPVNFEFQINDQKNFIVCSSITCDILPKNFFVVVYRKFKFNWASCILSGNPEKRVRC